MILLNIILVVVVVSVIFNIVGAILYKRQVDKAKYNIKKIIKKVKKLKDD